MSVVYGESNCGKTFFMTDLAYHIATGRRWRGAEVERGGVIYVALEGGFGIKNRVAALRLHYAPGETGREKTILFGVVACSINLLDANADTGPLIDLIKEAAEEITMPIRLVVVDTLSRAMNGGNENAPEDMGKLIKSADRIREETGAHVAFVHHSGKDQARGARGHSSLRAATDTEIEIVREEGTDISIATVNKQRELEIDGQFAFTLKQVVLGANKRGKEVTSCVVVAAETPERTTKKVKLTDQEWSLWKEIGEIYAREGLIEFRAPEPGMPVLRVLSREALRKWLIKRGKLSVTERVTGATRIDDVDRKRLSRTIIALSDKGFLGMNEEFLWKMK
jgi:KaiC/GvpD/RAD55 family RecA-like ATPase